MVAGKAAAAAVTGRMSWLILKVLSVWVYVVCFNLCHLFSPVCLLFVFDLLWSSVSICRVLVFLILTCVRAWFLFCLLAVCTSACFSSALIVKLCLCVLRGFPGVLFVSFPSLPVICVLLNYVFAGVCVLAPVFVCYFLYL